MCSADMFSSGPPWRSLLFTLNKHRKDKWLQSFTAFKLCHINHQPVTWHQSPQGRKFKQAENETKPFKQCSTHYRHAGRLAWLTRLISFFPEAASWDVILDSYNDVSSFSFCMWLFIREVPNVELPPTLETIRACCHVRNHKASSFPDYTKPISRYLINEKHNVTQHCCWKTSIFPTCLTPS